MLDWLPLLALPLLLQTEPPQPPQIKVVGCTLTQGPGFRPREGKADPDFPKFTGVVAWSGNGNLSRKQIRLYLVERAEDGRELRTPCRLKAWEALGSQQWAFTSAWPGGSPEKKNLRVVFLRRGQAQLQAEGPIQELNLPSASPRPTERN